MQDIGFLADKSSAYNVGDHVRIYAVTKSGLVLPLNIVGRVVRTQKYADGAEFPLWLYDIATDDQVYTGIPVNRLSTYGGPLNGHDKIVPYVPEKIVEGTPLPFRTITVTDSL